MKNIAIPLISLLMASMITAGCLGPTLPPDDDTDDLLDIPQFLSTWDLDLGSNYSVDYGYRPAMNRQASDYTAYAGNNFNTSLSSISTAWLRNTSALYIIIQRGNDYTFAEDGSLLSGETIDQLIFTTNTVQISHEYTNLANGSQSFGAINDTLVTPSIVPVYFGLGDDASILRVGATDVQLPIDPNTTFDSVRITYISQVGADIWFQDVVVE